MKAGYFDIKRDMDFPHFCEGCLVGKTEEEMSDTKYCVGCQPIIEGERKLRDIKRNDYWSRGGQVYYLDEKAYGVAPNGKRVIIGTATEIQEMLTNNERTGNKLIDNILLAETNSW